MEIRIKDGKYLKANYEWNELHVFEAGPGLHIKESSRLEDTQWETGAAFLCLICNVVLALSSPSPLNGYHFGVAATSASRKVMASNIRWKQPKAYVPDGLTEEKYKQIRNDELAKQQKWTLVCVSLDLIK